MIEAREIVSSVRNNVTDSTAWIRNIAAVAGNDVHVQVEDRLPSLHANVDADVEAVGAGKVLQGVCASESLPVQ